MRRLFLALALGVAVAGCYLPQATGTRTLENQVLIGVYRCTAELVAGEATNDAAVDVAVVLRPLWLDGASEPFHEATMEPFVIPAGETVEWEGLAGEEIATPVFCGAELAEVSEA